MTMTKSETTILRRLYRILFSLLIGTTSQKKFGKSFRNRWSGQNLRRIVLNVPQAAEGDEHFLDEPGCARVVSHGDTRNLRELSSI